MAVHKMTPKKQKEHDLAYALDAVFRDGEMVTREAWNNREVYITVQGGTLVIRMEDGVYHPWTISEVDFFANDWHVIQGA